MSHSVRNLHGQFVFNVTMAYETDEQECIELCLDSPDCRGVVTIGLTCYFRGGHFATPELLIAKMIPKEGAHLFVIFRPVPLPNPPPPPHFRPHAGASGPTFLLFVIFAFCLALNGGKLYAEKVPWHELQELQSDKLLGRSLDGCWESLEGTSLPALTARALPTSEDLTGGNIPAGLKPAGSDSSLTRRYFQFYNERDADHLAASFQFESPSRSPAANLTQVGTPQFNDNIASLDVEDLGHLAASFLFELPSELPAANLTQSSSPHFKDEIASLDAADFGDLAGSFLSQLTAFQITKLPPVSPDVAIACDSSHASSRSPRRKFRGNAWANLGSTIHNGSHSNSCRNSCSRSHGRSPDSSPNSSDRDDASEPTLRRDSRQETTERQLGRSWQSRILPHLPVPGRLKHERLSFFERA